MSSDQLSEAHSESVTSGVPSIVVSVTESLKEITDDELVKVVEELQMEYVHLELENQVFENFLLKNDPAMIAGMGQILEVASKMQSQTQSTLTPERRDTADSLRISSRKTESVFKFTTTSASTSERGPRINLTQKMDLVMREMEEMQINLEKYLKLSHVLNCNLKAELEEFGIRESEVTEAKDIFEQKIVIEGVDTLTQRIPAEKWIRYMEEWLKSAESTIEKMRLRTSTLKQMFIKLSGQLITKEELGESIDAVDFDQLRIENKHLSETIDQKNNHLIDLKKMNGTANLVLSTNKKYLQKQVQDLSNLKSQIKLKEQKIVEMDKESMVVEKNVDRVRADYYKIFDLVENYKVPDVMTYVKTKATLSALKNNVRMWERRNHVERFALNTSIRQMRKLTGKTSRPSWFVITKDHRDSLSMDDDDDFPSIASSH